MQTKFITSVANPELARQNEGINLVQSFDPKDLRLALDECQPDDVLLFEKNQIRRFSRTGIKKFITALNEQNGINLTWKCLNNPTPGYIKILTITQTGVNWGTLKYERISPVNV